MQKTAERICSFLSKTVGETGQDRVVRKGRIAAGAPQSDFRGTAFTVAIDGHWRVNREGIVLVSPGNARLNRDGVAWPPKAHAATDGIVHGDAFDAGPASAGLFHKVTERQADQRIIVNDQGIHEPKDNASIRHDPSLVKQHRDLGRAGWRPED